MKLILISLLVAVAIASTSAQQCDHPHERYTNCYPFPECHRSCSYPDPPFCEAPDCDGSGCECLDDYVRDHLGECVHRTHCPPQ